MNPVDPSNAISTAAAAAAGASVGNARPRRKNDDPAQLRLGRRYEKLVQQATGMEGSDPAAVSRARDALQSQELDTFEAARGAAENISRLGI